MRSMPATVVSSSSSRDCTLEPVHRPTSHA